MKEAQLEQIVGMVYKYGGATYFSRAHLEWNQFPYQQEELSAFWQNS